MAREVATPAFLFVLALLVRLLFASSLSFPGLDDPPSYLTVARNLAEGRGLVIDAIWSYLVPFRTVTHPSNEFWMPLPSLVLFPFFKLFGPNLTVAQGVGAMIGAALAPITWLTARAAFQGKEVALFSGLLVAVNPLLAYQAVTADSSVYFAIFGAAALLLAASRLPLIAGLSSGVSYLARSEGALLVVLLMLQDRTAKRAGAVLLGAALVAVPWLMRNYSVFGTAVPVPAMSLMVLPDYSALFLYSGPLPVPDLGYQAALRMQALGHNLMLLLVQALFPIAPLAIVGFIRAHSSPVVVKGTTALAGVFLLTALLFPVPTIHGTFYHSVGAFLPLMTVLAVIGLFRLGQSMGDRLFGDAGFTSIVLTAAALFLTLFQLYMAVGAASELHSHWAAQFETATRWLSERPNATIMTNEPHTLHYASGVPTIMLPWGDSPDAAREAAQRFGARHVVGFGRFGSYPNALEGHGGFQKVFEEEGVWAYEVRP